MNSATQYTKGEEFTLGNGDSYVVMDILFDGTRGQIIAGKLTSTGKPHKTLRGIFAIGKYDRIARLVETYKAGSL